MTRFLQVAAAAAIFAVSGGAFAQNLIPNKRFVLFPDQDLPGGDISSIFDTTLNNCERACSLTDSCVAYVFNQNNGACFIKDELGAPVFYVGAQAGRAILADEAVRATAVARKEELSFLDDEWFKAAFRRALNIGSYYNPPTATVEAHLEAALEAEYSGESEAAISETAAAVNISDAAADWAELARRQLAYDAASPSLDTSINAYLRAEDENVGLRHTILVTMGEALEKTDHGRLKIKALQLAQSLEDRPETAVMLDEAIELYGLHITETIVEADLATPRICVSFSEELVSKDIDYANFVKLPDPGLVVELYGSRQLCVAGVEHGKRYTLTFRQGLPSAGDLILEKSVEITQYVRDRTPLVTFPGRGYVLPKSGDAALPVQTVNTEKLDLTLYRVTDRNLIRSIQDYYFGASVDVYDEAYFANAIGEELWTGTATVAQKLNKNVTTRLPMAEALDGQPAGIYALKAAVPGVDLYTIEPAWQWFVVSDLGITSISGVDGLHVFVRSLGTAAAKAGVTVELVNQANAVIGTTTTDDQGYARFDAGMTRGTGASTPTLVVVKAGTDDLAFLSLTGPEFDLSDRGVEGAEPAPPVDVFLTTDRGAYRAGETVYVTALARDTNQIALEGLPLTAVLTRPDGVEYSRHVVDDKGAGGYVVALPIGGNVPRGVWRLDLYADLEANALAHKTFLVEDLLPERIDFDLAMDEGPLKLGSVIAPEVTLTANYLFGAPGAGLAVEGEVRFYSTSKLEAFPGYVFGLIGEAFSTMKSLEGVETDEAGNAVLPVYTPAFDEARPLEARITVRVSEGSGRPVERSITKSMTPAATMIGVKPLFDEVVPEGEEARFELIAVDPALKPSAMDVTWKVNRIDYEYQWYHSYGDWDWERVEFRTLVAQGQATLGTDPVSVAARLDWGNYELVVEQAGEQGNAVTSMTFYAGWYAPADVTSTPDMLQLSLDKESYKPGEVATLRIVPRAAGTALVTVLSNRLVAMQAVEVTEGENLIQLPVTDAWGAGVYVTASVLRPMDVAAGRNPARALGLTHAAIDPGAKALQAKIEVAAEAAPRGPLDVAVKVDGVAAGETAYVTIAAVDVGILNLTSFTPPNPQDHYFGKRRLGVGIRDVYGRLIDGLNGTMGEVRSGGDGAAQARLNAPPPTEELVAYFTGPVQVGADGYARTSFGLPSFNGTVKVMAVAWSKGGVGQASADVLVRDPVVVTASLPRFMAPGDQSRLLLEVVHATGPAGKMGLSVKANGLTLGEVPQEFELAEGAKTVFEVPVTADAAGIHTVDVSLTTPDGKVLQKTLTMPVQINDPEVARITRLDLKNGQTFTFDDAAFADLMPGSAKAMLAVGPLGRLNVPRLMAQLDRYPYGCSEQITSRALPLLYFGEIAGVMGLKGSDNLQERIDEAVVNVLANQSSSGGFGLWGPGSGDFWLDAYVTDFLSRAKAQGYQIPDLAMRQALENLRNQVNSAPDFTAEVNGGGEALAYALMVLAREGAAAVGDLRYYADAKGDDFSTPIAQAQLGAALASYGDQVRADAMFHKAAAKLRAARPDTTQIWRVDYGTTYRDAAAVLALAAEAGSNAVDREVLTNRIVTQGAYLSTQEATWALLAAHGLIEQSGNSGISIDGTPADGPLVRVLDAAGSIKPITITNGGPDTTVTITTYGVPTEPEPAGGNGYAITRSYFTLSGEKVTLDSVPQGTRLVTVLEVIPFSSGEGRLMVADPLPAGFEIDNPNLMSSGSTSELSWLDTLVDVQHSEFRQDRFLTAVDWSSYENFRLAYIVRAVSPGTFHHPAASVEDMYRPDFRARTDVGSVTITP